jgi:hypothetical protein
LPLWDDKQLRAGEAWEAAIDAAIDSASVAILLVSPDFLASSFIVDRELPRLLSRARRTGLTILPLYVADAHLGVVPELVGIQGVNSPDRPLKRLAPGELDQVLNELTRRVEELVG